MTNPEKSGYDIHVVDDTNPHGITKDKVDLGNVDNTSDATKPISGPVGTALDDKSHVNHTHIETDITDLDKDTTAEVDAKVATKEDAFSKNSGFNLNIGNASNTVTEGNDPRLSDSRVPTSHPHNIGEVIGLQDELDGKSSNTHNHDTRYHAQTSFIDESVGVADAGKPIKLSAGGKIHSSMLEIGGLEPQGGFTPKLGGEYPVITTEPNGSYWYIEFVAETGFEFTTGDLIGEIGYNGNIMMLTTSGWILLASDVDPDLYYKLDGTTPLEADMPAGGNKITNLEPGTLGTDVVNVNQLTAGLNGKANTVHTHTESQITDLDKYTQDEVDVFIASREPTIFPKNSAFNHNYGISVGQVCQGNDIRLTNSQSHIASVANPHSVTQTQVGLSAVNNTTDLAKPISTATQTALNGKANVGDGGVPSGTRQPFAQASAPSGWVRDSSDTATNRMIRIVPSNGGAVGGSDDCIVNDKVPGHTHWINNITTSINGAHTHSQRTNNTTQSPGLYLSAQYMGQHNNYTQTLINSVMSDGDHTHTLSGMTQENEPNANWIPRYIDMIICTKS